MRYQGQGAEIAVAVPDLNHPQHLRTAFLDQYRALYGHEVENIPIEVVTWRVRVEGPRPRIPLFDALAETAPPCRAPEPHTTRPAWNPDTQGVHPTPIYRTSDLKPGMTLTGPAIVEDPYSTTVLGRGTATVLQGNTLVAEIAEA